MHFVFLAILLTFSTQTSADEMTYSDLKNLKVNVLLADSAKGACWTNLTESREYAEEKLRSAGATVVLPPSVPDYVLRLNVMSRRNKALPLCYGSIRVELLTRRARSPQIAQASNALLRVFGWRAMSAA